MRVTITGMTRVPSLRKHHRRPSGRAGEWRKLFLSCGHELLEREDCKTTAELGDTRYCRQPHEHPSPDTSLSTSP